MKDLIKEMADKIQSDLRQEEGEGNAGGNTGTVKNEETLREQLLKYALADGRVPKFSHGKSVFGEVEPMTYEKFVKVSSSDELERIADTIKLLDVQYPDHGDDYGEERARIKKNTQIFTPLCLCGGVRKDENAWFNDEAFLDIDKFDGDIRAFLQQKLTPDFCSEHGVWFATLSIGGDGGHVHFHLRKGETPAAGMKRVADALGIDEYDPAVKNASRACYMTPEMYWIVKPQESDFYFENVDEAAKVIEDGKKVLDYTNNKVPKAKSSIVHKTMAGMVTTDNYQGAKWEHIVESLVNKIGGRPEKGARHNTYGQVCGYMHNLVNNDAARLLSIIPDWGLPEGERMDMCVYYCGLADDTKPAAVVRQAIKEAKETTRKEKYNTDFLNFPPLTELDRLILSRTPEKYHVQMIMALPAIKGALFHGANYYNFSNFMRHFGFGVTILGAPASGKSFIKKALELLETPLKEHDSEQKKAMDEYREAIRKCRNKQNQPDDPKGYLSIIQPDTTLAKLAYYIENSNGDTMFMFSEELDELTRVETSKMSSKKVLFRENFDGGFWGQDRFGSDSVTAKGQVKINNIWLGTFGSADRFFDLAEIENGLASRQIFVLMPSMDVWSETPVFEDYTAKEKKRIIDIAYEMYNTNGIYYAPFVRDAVDVWKREKLIENEGANEYKMQYIIRAAEIGERAGVMHAIENGSAFRSAKSAAKGTQKEKNAVEYALWLCEMVYRNAMLMFEERIERLQIRYVSNYSNSKRYCPERCFADLPSTFTQQDIKDLQDENNWHPKISRFLGLWKQQKGKCRVIDNLDGTYTKVK